jgi:hypothetical protein
LPCHKSQTNNHVPLAPLQFRLLAHFATHPAGGYLIKVYGGKQLQQLKDSVREKVGLKL